MKHNISIIIHIIIMTVASQAAAQTFGVKFVACDSTGAGEPFATVRIYAAADTAQAVNVGVADTDGKFSQSLDAAGDYLLKVSAVGKITQQRGFQLSGAAPNADLGVITMPQSGNELHGVTVTAQAPLVTQEIDRLNYNVQSDAEAKTKSIFDLLRKVPLVTVDGQDNITVRGSSDFKIYKNGHPDPTISRNPKNVLKTIPASMIKRIEVITEPGAKYDAEGVAAILNIVTLDNQMIKGVTGTVMSGINSYGSPMLGASLITQIGKVVTSVNYGFQRQTPSMNKQRSENHTTYTDTGNTLSATGCADDLAVNVHDGQIEASYEPDTLNLLSLSFGGYYYNFTGTYTGQNAMTGQNGAALYTYSTTQRHSGDSYYDFSGRFDYQRKTRVKDETITLSYLLTTSRNNGKSDVEYSDLVNFPLDYSGYCHRTNEKFLEQTVQLDWTRPFAKHNKMETGLKYVNRRNTSRSSMDYYDIDTDMDSRFKHVTQIAAAYMSYTYSGGPWSARAGLRYEWSRLRASYPDGSQNGFKTDLSDWVPSASVSWMPAARHSLKLAFATRINRPGIDYLNPAVVSNAESKSFGNPELKSARYYSATLTYMFSSPKFTFQLSPSWSLTKGGILSVQYAEDDKLVTTYGNVGRILAYGSSGFAQWRASSKTSVMLNARGGWRLYKAASLDLRAHGWYYSVYGNVSQQLPWQLRLSAFGGYIHNAPDLYGSYSDYPHYGFSIERSFLKEDRLSMRVYASGPFSSRYQKIVYHGERGNFTDESTRWYTFNQAYGITISYRFGSLKAQVKKTASTITNDDMVGGSSKGK